MKPCNSKTLLLCAGVLEHPNEMEASWMEDVFSLTLHDTGLQNPSLRRFTVGFVLF